MVVPAEIYRCALHLRTPGRFLCCTSSSAPVLLPCLFPFLSCLVLSCLVFLFFQRLFSPCIITLLSSAYCTCQISVAAPKLRISVFLSRFLSEAQCAAAARRGRRRPQCQPGRGRRGPAPGGPAGRRRGSARPAARRARRGPAADRRRPGRRGPPSESPFTSQTRPPPPPPGRRAAASGLAAAIGTRKAAVPQPSGPGGRAGLPQWPRCPQWLPGSLPDLSHWPGLSQQCGTGPVR